MRRAERRIRPNAGALLVCCAAFLIGCGSAGEAPAGAGLPGGPTPPPRSRATGLSSSTTIGTSGGSVSLATPDGASLAVTVPAGAVASDTIFTIEQIATDPAAVVGAIGTGYRLSATAALAAPIALTFTPPAGIDPATVTAAEQASVGYWLRVYSVSRDAATVSTATTFFGDWSLVALASQLDLAGPVTVTSTLELPFTASGTVTLQYLGGDSSSFIYLPQGTLTLAPITSASGATCSAAPAGAESFALSASIAELYPARTPPQFWWGIAAQWNVACSDGTSDFVPLTFDSMGISHLGCSRTAAFASAPQPSSIDEQYLIDCGTNGAIAASWQLALAQ